MKIDIWIWSGLCVTLMVGCAALETPSPYDKATYSYDEVIKKGKVEIDYYSFQDGLCDYPASSIFDIKECHITGYRLWDEDDEVMLRFKRRMDSWVFYDKAVSEGKFLRVSEPIRRVETGGNVLELLWIYVPLEEFVEWSCRQDRVLVRILGDYYVDVPLDIGKIRQFLAKADDFLEVDLNEACLSWGVVEHQSHLIKDDVEYKASYAEWYGIDEEDVVEHAKSMPKAKPDSD